MTEGSHMGGRLLAVTGGHRYDRDAFASLIAATSDSLGWSVDHVEQPGAQELLAAENIGRWNAVLLHDIPGLTLARGREPLATGPTPDQRRGLLDLIEAGQGFVVTHHALAGWPTWDRWAEIIGGRFLYAPGRLQGVDLPASGYRMGSYRVDVAATDHPVCAGIQSFQVDDELYACPVFEDVVQPLLVTTADTGSDAMIDAYREVALGERVPAADQSSSALLGWANHVGPSRVVYILPGHAPTTMCNPMYRRLLANACRWVGGSGSAGSGHDQATGDRVDGRA